MTDGKRKPLANLEPPKFMKPGDSPELDQALDRLRFDSDIYAPGEYDVFGRRRNLKGLRPSQRDVPPWGAPPGERSEPSAQPEGAEPPTAPESAGVTAPEETADAPVPQERSEPAAPPVASPAEQRRPAAYPTRARLGIAGLAVLAVLASVLFVLVVVVPRANPGPPPKSTAQAPAVAAPTTSATSYPSAMATPAVGNPPPQPPAVPPTSAVVPPSPAPTHTPGARVGTMVPAPPTPSVAPTAAPSVAPTAAPTAPPAPPPPPAAPPPAPPQPAPTASSWY